MVKNVVFVLGPPGVGKGTQCLKISEKYGFTHFSAGDLLREEQQDPWSQNGEVIRKCIKEGKIVPAAITCKLLEKAMENSGRDLFLIDGFPRNQQNQDEWAKSLAHKVKVLFVLFINSPVEVCIQRCIHRGTVAKAGRIDDNIEVIEKRIYTYIEETQPTISYYENLNLVKFIDGNRPEGEVFADIQNIFHEYGF